MIALGALAGLLAFAAVTLVVYALRPPAPRLAHVLTAYDRSRAASVAQPASVAAVDGWRRRVGMPVATALLDRGWLPRRVRDDLALLDVDPVAFAISKTGYAFAGLMAPVVVVAVVEAAGASLPLVVPAWLCLTGALVAFLIPDLQIRSRADAGRRDFRVAVGAYLDLVAMQMASGAGLAEALHEAARVGGGPAFGQLRRALADARIDGLTPAAAIGRLGARIGLPDLVELAARLSLVDTAGAQAETSLRAHAATLRDRELSELRGAANERSQSMLVAQVVLGFGFLVFLTYPALARVLAF